MTTFIDQLRYSFLGNPVDITIGPTVSGDMIHIHVEPMNVATIIVLIIAGATFLLFLWMYIAPQYLSSRSALLHLPWRKRPPPDPDAEKSCGMEGYDHDGVPWRPGNRRHGSCDHSTYSPSPSGTVRRRHGPSPLMLSALTPPPPAYCSQPGTPTIPELSLKPSFAVPGAQSFGSPLLSRTSSQPSPRPPSFILNQRAKSEQAGEGSTSAPVRAVLHTRGRAIIGCQECLEVPGFPMIIEMPRRPRVSQQAASPAIGP